jgi:GNAT superfamily N-acetyltransferase
MASNWANYIIEREGKFVLEKPEGFAIYHYLKDWCYIVDVYVAPEFRASRVAAKLAEEIAEEALKKGYKKLLGSVDTGANNATKSLQYLLKNGFKLMHNDGQLIYLEKAIEGK